MRSLTRSQCGFIDGQMFIGGRWTATANHTLIDIENPATEEVIATVPDATEHDAHAAIRADLMLKLTHHLIGQMDESPRSSLLA